MYKNNFVKYVDLLTINKIDSKMANEEFIFLPEKNSDVIGKYSDKCNMLDYDKRVPVRKSVYEKLKCVAQKLKKIDENYVLHVVYGYRAMEMQIKYFNEIYEQAKNNFDKEIDLYEYIHEKIAVPKVAGHPTGGAVDIEIWDTKNNKSLDFGSDILDWNTQKCYYENEELTETERKIRKLLRTVMMSEGFAPYDGEWWHFSYGDKEWAFYYKKEMALYNQVNASEVYRIK